MLHVSRARAQAQDPSTDSEPEVPPEAHPTPPPSPGDRPDAAGERVPDTTPPLALLPDPGWMDPKMTRSWETSKPRPFAATTVDFGWVYLRPRLSLGYGVPFHRWVGIDANPTAQSTGLGAYAGVRVSLPYADLRVGTRFFLAFQRSYLAPSANYERIDIESNVSGPATYLTHEAELAFTLPAGPGDILLVGSGSYITGVPQGQFVFENTLRVVVDPPLVWRARAGYQLRFGANKQHSVGLVGDVLDVPKRDDSLTFRVGPILRIVLSRRVEVRGSFVATVSSRDNLGLAGGDFTELGVRYRWATD